MSSSVSFLDPLTFDIFLPPGESYPEGAKYLGGEDPPVLWISCVLTSQDILFWSLKRPWVWSKSPLRPISLLVNWGCMISFEMLRYALAIASIIFCFLILVVRLQMAWFLAIFLSYCENLRLGEAEGDSLPCELRFRMSEETTSSTFLNFFSRDCLPCGDLWPYYFYRFNASSKRLSMILQRTCSVICIAGLSWNPGLKN